MKKIYVFYALTMENYNPKVINKHYNEKLDKNLKESRKIILENKTQIETLNSTIKSLKTNAKLTEGKIQEAKLAENNKVKELEARIKELEQTQNNFAELSFNPLGAFTALNESLNNDTLNDYDEEDKELFNVLTNK